MFGNTLLLCGCSADNLTPRILEASCVYDCGHRQLTFSPHPFGDDYSGSEVRLYTDIKAQSIKKAYSRQNCSSNLWISTDGARDIDDLNMYYFVRHISKTGEVTPWSEPFHITERCSANGKCPW